MQEYKSFLRECREEINKAFVENTQTCIRLCFELIKKIKKYFELDMRAEYNLWFCYYTLSECYSLLKQYKHATRFAKESFKYIIDKTYYYKSLLIINISYCVTDKNKAIKIYDKCLEYYCNIESHFDVAVILKNKGEMLRDLQMIDDAIELYRSIKSELINKEVIINYIDSAYIAIVDIHIGESNYFLAKKYIKNINNITLKNKYNKLINDKMLLV